MHIFRTLVLLAVTGMPLAAAGQAQIACSSELLSAMPVRATVLSTLAVELNPGASQVGGAVGVLGQAFDEALSVDNVLLRIRQDGCRAMANVRPAGVMDANDPAAYKPKTQFDNTPWRFNMTQNGKRMTADEFDAWMKARGVRVVGRKDAAVPAAPAPAEKPKQ
jgi:hypothetical protein